jgi:hypothetical protein
MDTVSTLDELAELVEQSPDQSAMYVRWSRGPDADLSDQRHGQSSVDALTGVVLPGLSANPLRVEPWWGDRSVRLWVARRLYDYRHLREQRGPDVRPWVLLGDECGRGPDNEPLVLCRCPLAWISDRALHECEAAIERLESDEWGPLRRS